MQKLIKTHDIIEQSIYLRISAEFSVLQLCRRFSAVLLMTITSKNRFVSTTAPASCLGALHGRIAPKIRRQKFLCTPA